MRKFALIAIALATVAAFSQSAWAYGYCYTYCDPYSNNCSTNCY